MNAHQRRALRRTHPKTGAVVEFWGPRGEVEIGIIGGRVTLRECWIVAAYGNYGYVPYRLIVRVLP